MDFGYVYNQIPTLKGRKYVLSSSVRVDRVLSEESVEGSAISDKFDEMEWINQLVTPFPKTTVFISLFMTVDYFIPDYS